MTTSQVEVTNISQHGFWLLLDERELFLSFAEYPWSGELPSKRFCGWSSHGPVICTGQTLTSTCPSIRSNTRSGIR